LYFDYETDDVCMFVLYVLYDMIKGVFTTRHYTNPRLPLPLLMTRYLLRWNRLWWKWYSAFTLYTARQKTVPFYFCNNFVKSCYIWI